MPPPVTFQVLDVQSPSFESFMVDKICDHYGIPPCDEVRVLVVRSPVNCTYRFAVRMFNHEYYYDVSDATLTLTRDPASLACDTLMRAAAKCWMEVSE